MLFVLSQACVVRLVLEVRTSPKTSGEAISITNFKIIT